MTIPTNTALWLQEQLLGLYHEDWGLIYMLNGNLVSIPDDTPERWQLGVDLIYRGLVCDLIKVNDFGATPDRASYLRAIQTLAPYENGAGSGTLPLSGALLASASSLRLIFRRPTNATIG